MLSHESKKHLCKLKVSANDHMVLRAIELLTDDSATDSCNLSNIQISNLTGIACNHVGAQLSLLAKRKVIYLGKGHCRTIKINPDLDEWQLKKSKTEPDGGNAKVQKVKIYKPVRKKKRNMVPEWFKRVWRAYPGYRRGGNYHLGWKKWVEIGLTESDANEAYEWLLKARDSCPSSWGTNLSSGFALGFVKFIGTTHWRTPVPAEPKKPGHQTTDFSTLDFRDGENEWNDQ